MKHILVIADPVDREQIAFQKALKLAKLTFADIHVVSFVFEPLCEVQNEYKTEDSLIDLKQLVLEHAHQFWRSYESSQKIDVSVTHEIVWEKCIHEWVLSHCQDVHYDLIVKTGHRTEGLFHTATDWQLFRESTVPVYSVTVPEKEGRKIILAALDLETTKKEKRQSNETILEAAFQLSVQMDAVLHCCYGVYIPAVLKDLDIIDVGGRLSQARKKALEDSKELLDLYDIDKNYVHIHEGKPHEVINDVSTELEAQCIVVGSMGRKGVKGKLIGNTAEKVVHCSKTDLLVI